LIHEARFPNLPSDIEVYETTRDNDLIATAGGMAVTSPNVDEVISGHYTHPDLTGLNPSN